MNRKKNNIKPRVFLGALCHRRDPNDENSCFGMFHNPYNDFILQELGFLGKNEKFTPEQYDDRLRLPTRGELVSYLSRVAPQDFGSTVCSLVISFLETNRFRYGSVFDLSSYMNVVGYTDRPYLYQEGIPAEGDIKNAFVFAFNVYSRACYLEYVTARELPSMVVREICSYLPDQYFFTQPTSKCYDHYADKREPRWFSARPVIEASLIEAKYPFATDDVKKEKTDKEKYETAIIAVQEFLRGCCFSLRDTVIETAVIKYRGNIVETVNHLLDIHG